MGSHGKFNDRGVIVEIKLENFITYSNVVIYPGRNMNVIIGPNGTGKSTIVTALALGFGGTLKLIGKPDMGVGETVKAGCESARIDITVKDTDRANKVFSRTIDKSNKSTWLIDNNQVNVKKFKEVVTEFNIQVDNLTQFLPQENIKGFSELTGKQLLQNTERSVADTSLEKYHSELIENRKRQKALEESLSRRTQRLEIEQQRYETLSEEVGQLQERKRLKKKLQTLKQKRAWIEYDIQRKKCQDSKARRDKAAADMKEFDERLTPIDNEIKKLDGELKILDRKLTQNNQKLISLNRDYKKYLDDIEDLYGIIRTEEEKCKADIENETQRDRNIEIARQFKEKLDNDFLEFEENNGSEDTIRQQVSNLAPRIETQRKIIQNLSQELDIKKGDTEQLVYQITNRRRQQQVLKDIESRRMDILMQRSRDAYRGVTWLRQNLHLFSKKVWEPMMLHIQVKEDTYAKYFENVIAYRDLIAFVCEDKDDMALLLRHLRNQQKLQVNVVHSDPQRRVSMTPRVPLNNIKQFGFTHYLIELIEAPEPILKYIVNMYNIQNIPIGTAKVDDVFENVPAQLQMFFSKNKNYYVTKSQYSGQKSTKICDINQSGMLSLVLDTAQIRSLDEIIFRLNQEKEAAVANYNALEEKIRRERESLEKLRDERQSYTSKFQELQRLQSRMRVADDKLNGLVSERISIDDIKAKRNKIINNLLNKQLKFYDSINKLCDECFRIVTVSESIGLQSKSKSTLIILKKNESRDLRENVKEAEKIYKELDTKLNEMAAVTEELFNSARQLTNGFAPQNKEEFKSYNLAFSRLPQGIDEIDEMIEQTRARVYCTNDNPDVENILQEYEKTKQLIEKGNDELETMRVELETNQRLSDELRDKWLPPLRALVDKISTNFSNYLGHLGCAGQVNLLHGDNPDDFEEYSLKIMVKFRAEEPLQEFTKNRQSGGETSLTTAMYMIALQEISHVPFRCVDEINQGMDATNDRKVFEHIMQLTSKRDSPQYFLLTPKLLPNLPYNDSVTVLCVFNGPNVLPHNQWNIDDYCKKLEANKKIKQRQRVSN